MKEIRRVSADLKPAWGLADWAETARRRHVRRVARCASASASARRRCGEGRPSRAGGRLGRGAPAWIGERALGRRRQIWWCIALRRRGGLVRRPRANVVYAVGVGATTSPPPLPLRSALMPIWQHYWLVSLCYLRLSAAKTKRKFPNPRAPQRVRRSGRRPPSMASSLPQAAVRAYALGLGQHGRRLHRRRG